MATAAALLERQPLMHLQHENYQLREENRHLHWQVKELLDWKARAVRHMVALAPKRSKAQREIKHATQLQKQLHAVEKTLQERVALEKTAHLLEQKEQMLAQCIDKLENEKQALSRKCEQAKLREEKLVDGLQFVSDMFRVHLEKLVAMRETIDTTAATDSSSAREPTGTASTGGGGVRGSASSDHTNESFDSTTLMITGLTAVSEKCIHWFHEHVEQTFIQQQQKAELYEAQHAELEQLRSRVESVQQTHLESASKDQHYRVQVTQLQHVNVQLENELSKFQTRCVEHSHTQNQLGDQMRLLVTEIRQYLRLVRVEIKKKFGYVPEAIAHAENWSRILDALERHVRLANVAITSPSRAR